MKTTRREFLKGAGALLAGLLSPFKLPDTTGNAGPDDAAIDQGVDVELSWSTTEFGGGLDAVRACDAPVVSVTPGDTIWILHPSTQASGAVIIPSVFKVDIEAADSKPMRLYEICPPEGSIWASYW